jgi:predicted transcriptional regulator
LVEIDIRSRIMTKADLELFEGEWAVLQVVWQLQPCAAPTVQEALQSKKGWAYTTVKTTMDRMVRKGLLETEKIRNLYLYRAAVTKPQAQRSEIMRVVKRAFNGTLTPMMQFLIENDELSEEQYNYLERLIKSRKRKTPASKRKK